MVFGDLFKRGKNYFGNLFNRAKKTFSDWSSGQYHFPGYNYLGPGTKIEENIESGIEPINDTDAAAKAHDLDYLNIGKMAVSDEEKKKLVRDSDKKFIDRLNKNKESDLWGNLAGRVGIRGKIILEDLGLLNPIKFL